MKTDRLYEEMFFKFIAERHALYERRQAGLPQDEWTKDPTLQTRKFTNVFRWLDPGTQFLLTDLLPRTKPVTALYRATLYRYTNWPATWIWMREELGHYPDYTDPPQHILDLLRKRRDAGHQMFSGAYMILPQPGKTGDKLFHVVALTANVSLCSADFWMADTQAERHAILKSNYGVGDFLGLQILTDIMYKFGGPFTENEFVVGGPGSRRGAALVAPSEPTEQVIRWAHEKLLERDDCPVIMGIKPSLMDVQNCFCELSKLVRGPKKTMYRPAHPGPLPDPVIPKAYLV